MHLLFCACAAEQVRAWDSSQDFTFSPREFLIMMKKIILNNAHDDKGMGEERKASRPFSPGPSPPPRAPASKSDAVPPWLLKLAELGTEELTAEHARAVKAAVMLQARVRGRLARRRMPSSKKRREEASKLWYEQIKPGKKAGRTRTLPPLFSLASRLFFPLSPLKTRACDRLKS